MSKRLIAAGRLPDDALLGDPRILADDVNDLLREMAEHTSAQHGLDHELLCLIGKAQGHMGLLRAELQDYDGPILMRQLEKSLTMKTAEACARVAEDSGSL